MAAGKLTSKKQRPTSAGLNILQPKPPNVILPTPIDTNEPMSIIQMGKLLGKFMPKSKPVSMAELSESVVGRRSKYLVMAHSKNMHEAILVRQTTTEPRPK